MRVPRTPRRLMLWLALGATCGAVQQPRETLIQNARGLEQKGDFDGASAAWRQLLERDPADVEALVNLGILSARREHYSEAQQFYRRALRRTPNDAAILLNLALAYFKNNDLKAAIPVFEKVRAQQPQNEQARTLLGICYYGTGDFRRAWPVLESIPAAHSNLTLRQMLAHAYIWSGEMEKGSREVEALLKDSPDSAVAHMLLGEAFDGQGKPAEALKEFEAAARINDSQPNVHFAIGFLHWRDKRFEDAEREFRRELSLDPAHSQALAYLGDIELQRGNAAEARRLLAKACASRDDIRVAEYDNGVLLQKDGDHAGAVRHFKRAVALAPDRADAHYRLAASYRALGQDENAASELQMVKSLHDRKLDESITKVAPAPND